MATILVKVFSLALRSMAKPLGHQFQEWALQHPTFRQTAIAVAQVLHRMEVHITRGAAGKESKAFVGRMSDERALEMAAKVVSEGFVFSARSNAKEKGHYGGLKADLKKKKLEEDRVRQLRQNAAEERQWLQRMNDEQTQWIQELSLRLDQLEQKFNGFQFKKR